MKRSSRYIGHDEPRHGESHVNEYLKCALVPLSLSLRSLLEGISHLADAIDLAKQCCRNKTDHLDQDQASAIYLYTMDIGHENVYSMINLHLRTNDRVSATPWFPYIKLLHTAVSNLPSYTGSIWRGVHGDVAKSYRKDAIICWGSFASCTRSISVIKRFLPKTGKGTLFMIECRSGRAISEYSEHPDENEILLLPEIKLKVVDEALDVSDVTVVHLQEVHKAVTSGELNSDVITELYPLSSAEKTTHSDKQVTHHSDAGKVVTRFSAVRRFEET